MGRNAPQPCREMRLVSPELRHRAHVLYARLGQRRKLIAALRTNEHTADSLLNFGMLREDTIARIEEKLTELGV